MDDAALQTALRTHRLDGLHHAAQAVRAEQIYIQNSPAFELIQQACGLGQYSLLFAILRKIVLEIPALYILNYFVPLYGLACAQAVAEVVLAAAAVIILARLFRRMSAEGTPLRPRGEKK